MPPRHALLAAVLLGPMPAAAQMATPLEQAMYDYGVAEYCGLVDQAVWDGYRAEANAIIAAEALGEDAVKEASFNAALAVDLEASDRGLGGYRKWCREDGQQAADRFRARAAEP
jgi:hypothetical protein